MRALFPAGYMAKQVALKPEHLHTSQVRDLYSVSACISKNFADYIHFWKHNGYGFFNTAQDIFCLAQTHHIELSDTRMFYYEMYVQQWCEDALSWESFEPEEALETKVEAPRRKQLEGFDVVSFYCQNVPECSYLSCNHMAETLDVNEHCLLDTLEQAIQLVESNTFFNCEPGPCRILAVYSVV